MQRLILSLALVMFATTVCAQTLAAEYRAGNDPASEGWRVMNVPDETQAGLVDDDGTSAWFARYGINYSLVATPEEVADAAAGGFVLRTVVRAIGDLQLDSVVPSHVEPRGSRIWYDYDDNIFMLRLGTDADGNLHLSPMMDWFAERVMFVVAGSSDGYHDIQIVQDPASGLADIYVDGAVVYRRWAGSDRSGGNGWGWGVGCEGCQLNVNLFQFWVAREVPVSRESTSFGALKSLFGNTSTLERSGS